MQNKSDKFDYFIALAATKCLDEEAKALKETDVSNVEFDAEYYRKREKVINKTKRRAMPRIRKRVIGRVAVAVMIIVMSACVLIGCVPGWRQAIYEAIVRWYDDCFTVRYEEPDGKPQETTYYEELEETTLLSTEPIKSPPTYIEEIRKPTGLPEGAWEDVVLQSSSGVDIDYYLNEEYLFSFTQRLLKPNDNYVDNEDVNVTYIKINGNDATVVEYVNKEERYILWSDGEYSYYIISTECGREALIGYAESVK